MEQENENSVAQQEEEVEFEYDWLTREKLQFKLLVLLVVLADNHLAFRGTLEDMCTFLGVATDNRRVKKSIPEAIAAMEKDGLLKQMIDGNIFTITLSKDAETQRHVIRIQREWVMAAKNYASLPNKSENVCWSVLLKVWLFLIGRENQQEPITNKTIGKALGIPEGTIKNARSALQKDIQAIISKRFTTYDPKKKQPFHCAGTIITVSAFLPDTRSSS